MSSKGENGVTITSEPTPADSVGIAPSPASVAPPTVIESTDTPMEMSTETKKPTEETDTKSDETKSDKPPLADHDSSVVDLAFAMDCTGSMGSYIAKAQSSIRNIVEEIVATEKSDIHLALVEYRDHPPQDTSFVTRVLDFTPSVSKMKKQLDACSASGGGDCPEAVADALHQVSKLSWREEATKICVFIADAPPHGLGTSGDGFPNGCPDGIDPMEVAGTIVQKGITMYMVGCEPAIMRYKDFFMTIAHMTGGQYVPLVNASLLAKVIIGGAQEEITLERLMQDAQEEVEADVMEMGGWDRYDACEDEITERVMSKVNAKGGLKLKQLQMNACALPEASSRAKNWSKMTRMSDVRKDFTKGAAEDMEYVQEAMSSEARSSEAKSSKKSGGRMTSFLGSIFSRGKRSSTASPSPPTSGEALFMESASDDSALSSPAAGSSDDSKYTVVENDCIDIVQTKRMLNKMKAKKM